jgi:hypothetical protein
MRTNFSRIVHSLFRAGRTMLLLAMLLGATGLALTQNASASAAIPVFEITNVVKDSTVTIKTYDFPADHTFIVTMGKIGTRGVGGIQVGTTYSGTGGSFTAIYDIPDALKGDGQIAIRLEATTGGYYSYNWFWNNPANFSTSTAVYTGIPTFDITYVVKDATVTIKAHNFPAHKDFVVRMGAYGTLGIGGTVVGTTNSESGGTFTITYTIPDGLKGQSRIAIRMDSTSGGYYSYNWFWNGQQAVVTSGSSYTGIPTFTIAAVVRDNTVTISTNNFPADRTFTVRMGLYGTLGIGGIEVATTDSGTGGSFNATYTIPAELQGQSRIAIRLDSTTGGFNSYGWFWNNTYP